MIRWVRNLGQDIYIDNCRIVYMKGGKKKPVSIGIMRDGGVKLKLLNYNEVYEYSDDIAIWHKKGENDESVVVVIAAPEWANIRRGEDKNI